MDLRDTLSDALSARALNLSRLGRHQDALDAFEVHYLRRKLLKGAKEPIDEGKIAHAVFSYPEIASVGMTSQQAAEQEIPIRIGTFPIGHLGKAMATRHPDGFVKMIRHRETGQLLGAHMIGAEVTEMLQGYGIAMNLETTEEDLMHTIFAHPTLSEMMHEAVLSAYDRAIHF